jgi:2-polyprenyl-3-methyl-5-hydroxy-6-metoxy-1,4-benzoquinol methylase
VDPAYSERYRDLFENHWWWRARTELVVETLRRLCPPQGWKNILDIGCGDGLFFGQLSEFGEIEGVEPCEDLVEPLNPYFDHIHICPFDENFRPGKQYSLILMLDVLEHLEDPVAALRHVLRLLAPEGTFVATVPAFMSAWTNHDVMNRHFTRYTKLAFRKVAHQAGIDIQEERYLYHWTYPAKLGVRIVERLFRRKPATPTIPAAWLNEALYWVSRIEQKTLSALPMPFGSSLIVVGARGASADQRSSEVLPLE